MTTDTTLDPAMRARWEPVIGLEVHAQLRTETKLFCGCPTKFGAPPNTQVCPVCLGHPGVLPVLNRRAVELAVRMGLATGCVVREDSIFARKNYFYPDLPKNYQISQYDRPICEGGALTIEAGGRTHGIGITRIHLEEDAGKSKHPEQAGDHSTRIDLNRCGTPLIEIVSEPDLRSAAQAHAYLTALKQLLQYLEVCDGNMEEGSLRCDANVSVRRAGTTPFGTRTELKNLNSFRFVERAIDFEIERQIRRLEAGGAVVQQTLLWNPSLGETRVLRSKEDAHDYRYFPDPDLPPLRVSSEWIDRVRGELSELPAAKRARFERDYALSFLDAGVLTQTRALADYYEAVAAGEGVDAKSAANWIASELLGQLNKRGLAIDESPVSVGEMQSLMQRLGERKLNGKLGKMALEEMIESGATIETIVARHGWEIVADDASLQAMVDQVIAASPTQVAEYRAGKESIYRYFVGQVMKLSKGQADAVRVDELIARALRGEP